MTQEEFDLLAGTRSELTTFLMVAKDKDFQGVAAHTFVCSENIYRHIKNKEITKKIIALVQNELDNINKKIEEL